MFPRRTFLRVVSCATVVLFTTGSAVAQSELLVEMKSSGNCFDCDSQRQQFIFHVFTANPSGLPGAEWQLPATTSGVGQTFDVPAHLLNDFNVVLTSSATIGLTTQIAQSPHTIHSGNFTEGTMIDVPSVKRFVPVLGENLSGYRVTNITQTIDAFTVTPLPSPRYDRIHGENTIRIFGYAVPEPSAIVLFAAGILIVRASSRIRRPRR